MSIKKLFVAASFVAMAAPAFAQDETRVTPSQCVELGGVVNQAAGTCTGVDAAAAASTAEGAAVLGGGLSGGAVAAGAGLLLVLAAGGSSSSSTTTTTTGS